MVVVSAFELVLDDHGPSASVLAEQIEIEPSDGMLDSTQGQCQPKRATETVEILREPRREVGGLPTPCGLCGDSLEDLETKPVGAYRLHWLPRSLAIS